jgi:hypothetical protein
LKDIIYSINGGRNIPVGNFTSQWFGNLYLNELDQFIKHVLRVRCYIRYCDDFILLHQDKQLLNGISSIIQTFLDDKLDLKLSKNQLFPLIRGVDFLGYRHFPDYILLRKSTAKRAKKRMKKLPLTLYNGRINNSQFSSSIASTQGWLRWCNSFNFSQSLNLEQLANLCYDQR